MAPMGESILSKECPMLTELLPQDDRSNFPSRYGLFRNIHHLTEKDFTDFDSPKIVADWPPHSELSKRRLFKKYPAIIGRFRLLQESSLRALLTGLVHSPTQCAKVLNSPANS